MSDIQPASFADLKKAWDFYRQRIDRTIGKEEVNYRTYRLEFLRGIDQIKTQAKADALRDARSDWHKHADQMTDEPSKYYPAVWLRHRADQMEGDDAE